MTDAERHRLIHGPYRTPRFRYGAVVMDEVRGEVMIVGLTDARIPWPVGKRGRARSLVVYGQLAEAVRRESGLAICHWWGLTPQTVSKWRKALGIGPVTEGTSRLRRIHALSPKGRAALKKAVAKARDPQRRLRIALARIGVPRPPHVVEAVRAAHLGMKHTAEARRKMSEAQRRSGTRPPRAGRPWSAAEDLAVCALPPGEPAARTGRTLVAVWSRRRLLGLPDGRRKGS
jgi:hypothetical protein